MNLLDNLEEKAARFRRAAGRPLVTLSYAQSLDGCIAARPGEPLALSCRESQIFTHRLRAAHQSILVGIGTILADDPRLNVRLVEGRDPQPVVLDSHLRFPLHARLLQKGQQPPWIFTTQNADSQPWPALEQAGARLVCLPGDSAGRVSLPALLAYLAAQGVDSLMVEGGAQVITSFLAARLVDRVALTISPLFLGGLSAVQAPARPIISPASEPGSLFPRLKEWQSQRAGDDLLLWGVPGWEDRPL